jgi:signal transduction histidine kinase/FixJ family two-component response regulator
VYRAAILVVDDDEQVCDILKTSLTDAGYIVDAVLEPETALKKFREQEYDAVLVDVMLPKVLGTDLLAQLKQIDPDIAVILVTAHPAIDTARKAVQLQAFDYVQKPFELSEIIDKTKKAAGSTRAIREKREYERALKARLSENLKELEFQSQALKVEQERFYGIFKSANFGLMVLNGTDEKIMLINDQCKGLLKIPSLTDQQCFDKDYHHLVPPAISERIDDVVYQLKSTRSFASLEPAELARGQILEFQAYPVISNGNIIAIAIMVNDITQKKQLEKQLLMTSKLAGIGELAAGIAHEINNPIGFVKSNMGTLDEYVEDITRLVDMYHDLVRAVEAGKDTGEMVEQIKAFERSIDSTFVLNDIEKIVTENQDGLTRVAKIIRDLRTFTRFDGEDKSTVSINTVIGESLNLTRNECKYKAEVVTDLADVPDILGFGNQLSQVFINLIINAAQAIEKKGEIRIRSFMDGTNIVIEISDTGKGMDKETAERIFDPFFTTKPSGEGTGLGLSIAQDIVAKHKGTISVQSEPGRGTTFRIELPAKSRQEQIVGK